MNESYNAEIGKTKQEAIIEAKAESKSILKGSITTSSGLNPVYWTFLPECVILNSLLQNNQSSRVINIEKSWERIKTFCGIVCLF